MSDLSKKITIVVIIGGIFLGLIWLTKERPVGEELLLEEKFYTREDLRYIEPQPGVVHIYYMWMTGCPACAALDKWFAEMKEVYNIKVYRFDITREAGLFRDLVEAYNLPRGKRGFVPTVFIGESYVLGFNPGAIENLIKECLMAEGCIKPYDKLR